MDEIGENNLSSFLWVRWNKTKKQKITNWFIVLRVSKFIDIIIYGFIQSKWFLNSWLFWASYKAFFAFLWSNPVIDMVVLCKRKLRLFLKIFETFSYIIVFFVKDSEMYIFKDNFIYVKWVHWENLISRVPNLKCKKPVLKIMKYLFIID